MAVDSSSAAIEQNRISQMNAPTKPTGEDEGGSDNALMDVITNAASRFVSMLGKGGLPGTTVAGSTLSTGMQAGMESPEGFNAKKIMPSLNISGGDGFFFKIFLALKKGGMSIKNLCEGIEPQQAVDVSWARLGELPTPIGPNIGGADIGMHIG